MLTKVGGIQPERKVNWFLRDAPRPDARVTMVALPPAGSGASAYRGWAEALGQAVEFLPVLLPGREARWREPPLTTVEELVEALLPQLLTEFPARKLVLFGHSMGALLAFELASVLQERGASLPAAVVLTSHRSPELPYDEPLRGNLSDDDIVAQLRRIGGTPDRVLKSPELLSLMLPTLRSDVSVCERYQLRARAPLSSAVLVYYGEQDPLLPRERVLGWERHAAGQFICRGLIGGHFFVGGAPGPLLDAMTSDLRSLGIL